MERKLIIERENPSKERRILAEIPFVRGSYGTQEGNLEVEIFSPDEKGLQKVVFKGVIPTVQRRGQSFHGRNQTGGRRVVDFPINERKEICQDEREGRLIFRRVTRDMQSLAAD